MRSPDPDTILRHVAARIGEIRREKGLTQDQIAEALNCATKNYQRIEYGQNVTIKMLAKIANALDVPVADFFASPLRSNDNRHAPVGAKPRAKLAAPSGGPAAVRPPSKRPSSPPRRRRKRPKPD